MNEINKNMLSKEELEKIEELIKKIDPKNKTFTLTKEIININKKIRIEEKNEK